MDLEPTNFRLIDLINVKKMVDFLWQSLAMKIILVIIILFMLGLNVLFSKLPLFSSSFITFNTTAFLVIWLIFFYSNYVLALIVGIKEYKFFKYLLVFGFVLLVLFILKVPDVWYLKLIVRLIGFGLGIMIVYPNKASLKDIVFGYLSLILFTELILTITSFFLSNTLDKIDKIQLESIMSII